MAKPAAREPLRRNSRANRARILATARRELGRNPDVTLEELARAAGVVRRTPFGHFPGKEALLEALAEEAAESLRGAPAAGVPSTRDESAELSLARLAFSMWPVGDRYRLLLALAQRDLGAERVAEVLAPTRATATAILERGQRDGVFHTHPPAAALSAGLEAMTGALLESVNDGVLEDDGTCTAIATLIAAGAPEARACEVAEVVASTAAVAESAVESGAAP